MGGREGDEYLRYVHTFGQKAVNGVQALLFYHERELLE